MKILIANWVYNWGSTGFLARDLVEDLSRMGHEVIAATAVMHGEDPRVKVFTTSKEWAPFWRLGRIGIPRFSGSKKAAKRLIQQIEEEKPDVVNLHLLHCHTIDLYAVLRYLGEHGIKTVITNHAEVYYTGNCEHAYDCRRWIDSQCKGCPDKKRATGAIIFGNPHRNWTLMQKAISFFKPDNLYFTAVSPWLRDRSMMSPITKGFGCDAVLNGLDTEVFYPRQKNNYIFDRIGTEDYVLHVTASFNPQDIGGVKGSSYFVKLAEAMPEQKFVVVATCAKNVDKLPENIYIWGKAKDQNELAELYSMAKLTVIVSRRETFSMVTAESLCCGTPVAGFIAGGPESIAIPEASEFVEQQDVNGLVEAIYSLARRNIDRKTLSNKACEKYSSSTMAKGYLVAYEKILK